MQEKTLLDDPNFREFYVTANPSTYAAGGDQKAEIMENGGKRYVFYDKKRWPQWRYIDTYYGYNPFFGNKIIEEVPLVPPVVWTPIAQMSYGGYAKGTEDEIKRMFVFLGEISRQVSVRSLFRGPTEQKYIRENGLQYHCQTTRLDPYRVQGGETILEYALREGESPFYQLRFQFCCLH
ncbi:MAG: hypothetical protein AAB975_04825 [Patescibacteria group bacterium]